MIFNKKNNESPENFAEKIIAQISFYKEIGQIIKRSALYAISYETLFISK